MLSIIIPTKNEENYLPKLLDSIRKQKYSNYEVIVADNNSTDSTRKIAKKYGCRVVRGGFLTVGRNNGAKAAKSDLMLFLDADVILGDNFLRENIKEMKEKNLDVATCFCSMLSDKFIDKMIDLVGNFLLFISQYTFPGVYGFCIFSKKKVHNLIGGFNEKVLFFEDQDYIKRISKIAKCGVLSKVKIFYSPRRYDKDGRFNVITKYIIGGLYRLFKGEITDDKFNYKFDYKK